MNKHGEIIIVEDDADDREFITQAIADLGIPNKITVLRNGAEAFQYFNDKCKNPFLIISDINMPVLNGMELRDKMQKEGPEKLRSVPFMFLTTGAAADNAINFYGRSVQGFFVKPNTFAQLKEILRAIFDYWSKCAEPRFL